jgi:NADH-quinone oxidoreductase subunit N
VFFFSCVNFGFDLSIGILPILSLVSFFLILISLFLKVGLVPFYNWLPDVYDGSPTFVTLYFSTFGKVVSLGLIARVYWEVFCFSDGYISFQGWLTLIFFFCSFLSVLVGSLGAFFQSRLKRWVAYSGIVHAGFILLSFCFSLYFSLVVFFYYLFSYLVLVFGLFSVLFLSRGLVRSDFTKPRSVFDLRYVIFSYPTVFGFLIMNLFSLAGLPPLLGFFPKFLIFYFLIQAGFYVYALAFFSVSLLSVFYYLRLVSVIFFLSDELTTRLAIPVRTSAMLASFASFFFYINVCGIFFFLWFLNSV